MKKHLVKRLSHGALALSVIAATAPAGAATEDPTTTGIVAGLGLTAAGGKTSVSSGGGAIEATLLDSDAVLKAGDTIRRLAVAAATTQPGAAIPPTGPVFVVLGHGDSVDFTAARWLRSRLDLIDRQRPTGKACVAATPTSSKDRELKVTVGGKTVVPSIADIPAALATDISIQGITVATDDRLLVEAVAIGGYGPTAGWTPVGIERPVPTQKRAAAAFYAPGEVIDAPTGSGLIGAFNDHLKAEDEVRAHCPTDAGKAWLTTAQAFDASATSTEKGPAPIAAAAELLTLAERRPLVLHVAIEQSGGTAITRSNIFYTLGFPGAAEVSAGFLVSFRLADPATGAAILTGFVRCAVAPTRFQNVAKIVAATSDDESARNGVACSYITS